MASRTLLVNPQDDQKHAYIIANDALDVLIRNLKVGQPIKNAYLATKKFVEEKDPSLANKLVKSFGFGCGYSCKEDYLQINETNEILVEPNMTFHCRIAMTDINKKISRSIIAIGDLILINKDGTQENLTGSIQRRYSEISYSLD